MKPVEIPIRFPHPATVIREEAERFRRLTPTGRLMAIASLIASGQALMAASPKRMIAAQLRETQEEQLRRFYKELFTKNGE